MGQKNRMEPDRDLAQAGQSRAEEAVEMIGHLKPCQMITFLLSVKDAQLSGDLPQFPIDLD